MIEAFDEKKLQTEETLRAKFSIKLQNLDLVPDSGQIFYKAKGIKIPKCQSV